MRRILLIICAIFSALSVCGQQIESSPVGFDEFRSLLKTAGYEAFGFDLSKLLLGPERYDITLRIKEYESGVEIYDRKIRCGSNKLLVTDFREEARGDIDSAMMADPQRGIYRQAEKLTLGFYPSCVDSVGMLHFDISEMRSGKQRFELRSVSSMAGRRITSYRVRPFKIDSFASGKFIPLLFYGSMWFDAKHNLFRFCGEREIEPDLSSEIVDNVPHFYVIGIEFTEKKETMNLKNN